MSATSASVSTGPRTAEGKTISSQNALKHGLRANKLILPGESQEDFELLREDLVAEYQPTNTTEALLVDQFVIDTWRLQRARRVEIRVLEASPDLNLDELNKLARYQTSIERSYHRTLEALQRILAERRKQEKESGVFAQRAYEKAYEEFLEAYTAPPVTRPSQFVRQNPNHGSPLTVAGGSICTAPQPLESGCDQAAA